MAPMAEGKRGWRWTTWATCSAVAVLGLALVLAGARESALHLVLGGVVMVLLGAICLAWDHAMRPGMDGGMPSLGEKSAWQQLSGRMAVCLGLAGWGLASSTPGIGTYLLFCTMAGMTLAHPLLRRRFLQENRRHGEVVEDERDLALRAQGDRFSRRLLEFILVAVALLLALSPGGLQALARPLQAGAWILLSVLVAGAAGDGVVAYRYWRERQ